MIRSSRHSKELRYWIDAQFQGIAKAPSILLNGNLHNPTVSVWQSDCCRMNSLLTGPKELFKILGVQESHSCTRSTGSSSILMIRKLRLRTSQSSSLSYTPSPTKRWACIRWNFDLHSLRIAPQPSIALAWPILHRRSIFHSDPS